MRVIVFKLAIDDDLINLSLSIASFQKVDIVSPCISCRIGTIRCIVREDLSDRPGERIRVGIALFCEEVRASSCGAESGVSFVESYDWSLVVLSQSDADIVVVAVSRACRVSG